MANLVEHTALLCDNYYELKAPPGAPPHLSPGQLVWAHLVYPNEPPWIAEVTGVDPQKTVSYKITRFGPLSPAKPRFPIKDMNLRADENLYLLKGKFRPGVVMQIVSTDFYNPKYPELYASIIPCYTFKEKHNQQYRVRLAGFTSKNLFYLPSAHEGLEQESVLRFEHVQPVPLAGIRPIIIDGKHSFLSDTMWAILLHWHLRFLTGKGLDDKIEAEIEVYRTLLLDAYGL